jgi:hypothetical protein
MRRWMTREMKKQAFEVGITFAFSPVISMKEQYDDDIRYLLDRDRRHSAGCHGCGRDLITTTAVGHTD